jgi:hypothetical protein
VTLRRLIYWLAIAVSLTASMAAAWFGSWASSFALFVGGVGFAFIARDNAMRAHEAVDLTPWFDAMQGRDPFDPDVKPIYRFSGFATSFIAVIRVYAHPLLGDQRLVVFRDETDPEQWRDLMTHIQHGAFRHSQPMDQPGRV